MIPGLLSFAEYELDTTSCELFRRGARTSLQRLPARILAILASEPGRLFTRSDLQARLWPLERHRDLDRSLNSAVHLLRRVLRESSRRPRFIETLPGRGYRFIFEEGAPARRHRGPGHGSRTSRFIRTTCNARLALETARHLMNRRTSESLMASLQSFRKSIDENPLEGAAYSGMAVCYGLLGDYGFLPSRAAFPRASAAARRALQLNADDAEAHAALGHVFHRHDWDAPEAERSYRTALALGPQLPVAHHWYAEFLSQSGRHRQAVERIRTARDLDPLSPAIAAVEAWLLYHAGRNEEARELAEGLKVLAPDFPLADFVLGRTLLRIGDSPGAVRECRAATVKDPRNPFLATGLGVALAADGRMREACRVLKDLETTRRDVSPYLLAKLNAHVGRTERAGRLLRRAAREKSSWMLDLGVDPEMEGLRGSMQPAGTA